MAPPRLFYLTALVAMGCAGAARPQGPGASPTPPGPVATLPARDFGHCVPGTPCTIYEVDLTRNPGPHARVNGGAFTAAGWSCVSWNDALHLDVPDAAGISRGYLELTVSNWDPYNQRFAPGVPRPADPPRNEFLEVTEACTPTAGMRWKLRAGGGYKPFVKVEIGQPDLPGAVHIADIEDGRALHVASWSPAQTYTFRMDWDESSFRWSVADARFVFDMNHPRVTNHPKPLNGICNVGLGEMFPAKGSMGCLEGPAWRSLKVVSLSGPPGPAIRQSPPAAPPPRAMRPIKVGFIGQSLLHQPGKAGTSITGKNHFYYLLEWAKGKPQPVTEVHHTISGAGLHDFVSASSEVKASVLALMDERPDYFVMAEGTAYAFGLNRKGAPLEVAGSTRDRARVLADLARKRGAVPVFYVPHAHHPKQDGDHVFEKPSEVMKAYRAVAAELDMAIIPAAHAIEKAVQRFGHDAIYVDNVHINEKGQFLTGCVGWATLSGTPPERIEYAGDTAGLPAEERAELIRICKETLKEIPADVKRLTGKGAGAPRRG